MDCQKIKKLIPLYLDGELQAQEYQEIKTHLAECKTCQKESLAFEHSWDILSEFRTIEPPADYISRFWTELALRKPWYAKALEVIQEPFLRGKFVPALAAVCAVLIISLFSVRNYYQIERSQQTLSNLTAEEIEVIENMDLAENYELIENIDFVEDLDVIEHLDTLENYGA